LHHSDAPKEEEPFPKDPAEAVTTPCTRARKFSRTPARPACPHLPQNIPVCPGINALRGRTPT